MHKVGYFHR